MDDSQEKMTQLATHWIACQPVLAGYIASCIPDFNDAEDVLQRTAERIVRSYDKYDQDRPFGPWAFAIARNEVLTWRRKQVSDRHIFSADALERIGAAYEKVTSSDVNVKHDALQRCVRKLTDRARKVLELRYLRGMQVQRMAKHLGQSRPAVSMMLHRIRESLRRCVQKELGDSR